MSSRISAMLRRRYVEGLSITQKALMLTFLIGIIAWGVIDQVQDRNLHQIFLKSLYEELEREGVNDRRRFDYFVQAHHKAVKLILSQKGFLDYISSAQWQPEGNSVVAHYATPPWLPGTSILRSFLGARFTILMNTKGEAREVYYTLPTQLPRALLKPSRLLQTLSHNQTYLTEIDGIPYAVAAQEFKNAVGHIAGTLVVASPIDDIFLKDAHGYDASGVGTALVGGHPRRVIATSQPGLAPKGMALTELKKRFVVSGKSFFDYGASDLDIQFASYVALDSANKTIDSLLRGEQGRRIGLVAGLTLPFLVLIYLMSRRVRHLTLEVSAMSREVLGTEPSSQVKGDEVALLMNRFRAFRSELMRARDALTRQAQDQRTLARKATEAEQKARDLEVLRTVTEVLGIGVIIENRHGRKAANCVMQEFSEDVGGLEDFLTGDRGTTTTLELRGKHGARHFQVRCPALAGQHLYLVEDVTEQVRTKREHHIFSKLPGENPNPILRINFDGEIEYANKASHVLLSAWEIEPGGKIPRLLFHKIEAAMATGIRQTIELDVKDHSYSFVVALIENTEFLYLYGIDTTARKKAETALRLSEERFRGLLAAAPDAIIILGEDMLISYVNDRTISMFGYRKEELIGQPVEKLISPDMRSRHLFLRQTFSHDPRIITIGSRRAVLALCKGGQEMPVEVSISPMKTPTGVVVISIIRDVTERQRFARQVSKLNRRLEQHVSELIAVNNELEAFSYSVSHDLRGPLRTINAYSQILLEDHGAHLDAEGQHFLSRIHGASARMGSLIDNLLRLSRITRADISCKPIDLTSLVRAIQDDLEAQQREGKVRFCVAEGMQAVGDPTLIHVAMENLLSNAWKFTGKQEEAVIEIGVIQNKDRGRIYFVKDNGAGFDMQYADKLFSAFERLHSDNEFSGNGIGLATVARIIRKHDGDVWAEGEVGKGATFYFTLGECTERQEKRGKGDS